LTWNQRNRIVAAASDATLQIIDGSARRDIHLDGRQVADGSVLYRPQTNDVTFRLEVHGDQGITSGSVRDLDALSGRQPTLDVSLPGASLNPSQTASAQLPADPGAPTLLRDGASPIPTLDPAAASEPLTNPAASITPPLTGNSPALPLAKVATPTTTIVPLTGVPESSLPPAGTPARTLPASSRSTAPRHYETPETVGLQTPVAPPPSNRTTGSSTINGWDPVPVKPKAKSRAQIPGAPLTGFVGPRPLLQVTPNMRNIPAGAIPTHTRIAVQVNLDQTGHVTAARVLTGGVNANVATAAISAARQWTFDPAKSNGRHINSQHTIVFEFPAH
jgi:TonB family protein